VYTNRRRRGRLEVYSLRYVRHIITVWTLTRFMQGALRHSRVPPSDKPRPDTNRLSLVLFPHKFRIRETSWSHRSIPKAFCIRCTLPTWYFWMVDYVQMMACSDIIEQLILKHLDICTWQPSQFHYPLGWLPNRLRFRKWIISIIVSACQYHLPQNPSFTSKQTWAVPTLKAFAAGWSI